MKIKSFIKFCNHFSLSKNVVYDFQNMSPPLGPEWARAIPDKSPAVIVNELLAVQRYEDMKVMLMCDYSINFSLKFGVDTVRHINVFFHKFEITIVFVSHGVGVHF